MISLVKCMVLVLFLGIVLPPVLSQPGPCSASPVGRVECGFEGISLVECTSRLCCFNNLIPTASFCYQTTDCAILPGSRVGCPGGFSGISRTACIAQGCCFDDSVGNTLFCYQRTMTTTTTTTTTTTPTPTTTTPPPSNQCDNSNPNGRNNCGSPGVTPTQCVNMNCCFDNSVAGVSWCFTKSTSPPVNPACDNSNPNGRTNCGTPGISQADCENMNCCFDSSTPNVPWCFNSGASSTTVSPGTPGCDNSNPSGRMSCGNSGINQADCENMNCCFDNGTPNVPWCFTQVCDNSNPNPNQRNSCGFSGISQAECQNLNCCFDNGTPGVPWCFNRGTSTTPCDNSNPTGRTNCGTPGISGTECLSQGCCFDNGTPDVPWCFTRA